MQTTLALIAVVLLASSLPEGFAGPSAAAAGNRKLKTAQEHECYPYGSCDGKKAGCFPGDALVTHANGVVGLMKDVTVGDQVAALDAEGKVTFSDVYAFGHQDHHATSKFIRLALAGEKSLELSPGHFIPTGKGALAINKRASDIRMGDLVWALNVNNTAATPSIVVGVSVVKNVGLFNPLTLSGTIIVNGAAASVHSEWFLDSVFDALGRPDLLPATYQAILTPARLIFKVLGRDGYIWLYSVLDSMFSAVGGIADVGCYFGGAIAATGAAGVSAGLVLAAISSGSKAKAV